MCLSDAPVRAQVANCIVAGFVARGTASPCETGVPKALKTPRASEHLVVPGMLCLLNSYALSACMLFCYLF